MRSIFIFLLLLCFVDKSSASQTITPISQFRDYTFVNTCVLKVDMQLIENESIELSGKGKINNNWRPIYDCLATTKENSKLLFTAAIKSIANKPTAQELLKNYYAAWLSALDNVPPLPSERYDNTYRKRQRNVFVKSDEIWTRLKIELL